MSSSIDAGYYASQRVKVEKEKCPKGGQHMWKNYGQWPSTWSTCTKCKTSVYSK